MTPDVPSKTSIVFTTPNSPGALYKALACFSLREVSERERERRSCVVGLLLLLLCLVIDARKGG